MPGTFARPELLASPDWLAEHHSRPGVRVVDCRFRVDGSGPALHAEGHIPGAVYLDWARDLVDRQPDSGYLLAGPEAFAAAISAAGIGDGMTLVLYDDATSLYAGRVWWSLLAYGFESVRILDGGLPAWRASGRPLATAAASVEPAPFTPRADPRRRLATDDVRALLGSREVEFVDVRGPAEYHGQEGNARRLGHIPGAVNVPAPLLTSGTSQAFLEPDALARLFARAGLRPGSRIVTYDGSGIAACKAAFALTLLGHGDVAVYDGGWAEWGSRLDLPVDR